MRIHSLRHVTQMIVALAVFATASLAWGQVYKCADATGKTIYSDAPCDAAAKPHKLPEDPIRSNATTNPHMCAQLQDETHRLDAEAERDRKRGRAETADHAKQRQTMTARYAERCAGVSRSSEKAKF
ncbi:MAG: DUF4124 domain-containing protein [Casimicrobiaceae bacterium]